MFLLNGGHKNINRVLTNLQYVLNRSSCGNILKSVFSKQRCIWAREHTASISSPVESQSTKSLVEQHVMFYIVSMRMRIECGDPSNASWGTQNI